MKNISVIINLFGDFGQLRSVPLETSLAMICSTKTIWQSIPAQFLYQKKITQNNRMSIQTENIKYSYESFLVLIKFAVFQYKTMTS